eukprot:CAMPEP_0185038504 /NCGR_PEP_ID=MMETSP1103-20130426/34242_1 /TAXON_ID=36769 /ORGANISM="Paraphysomonas bandaiensis, Strain Caron Lab Isolate" /LENGTH=282 /DNA_ID=CAMNT_0027576969 /DNA_START=76 /DNA_END=921 /DNA_ORIENTATION=+
MTSHPTYYQTITSPPVSKAEIIDQSFEDVACKIRPVDGQESVWCFREQCVPWFSWMTPVDKISAYLTSISSLCSEGSYCHILKQWKRYFVTRDGILLELVEDVPEAGGQNCLWAAGLVMARYMDNATRSGLSLNKKRVLELGAGAALPSMVAALHGGVVYSTEQKTCMKYLQDNLRLNPVVKVHARELHWTSRSEEEKFDIILGCDITYDVHNFDAIFETVEKCLLKHGMLLICHDDDSCPLSSRAKCDLEKAALNIGLSMEPVVYQHIVGQSYVSPSIKMW